MSYFYSSINYFDRKTQNYYLQARYYNPRLGRFISLDPLRGDITNPLSLNRYVYAFNNPINYIDPNGEDAIIILASKGAPLNKRVTFGHISLLLQDESDIWYYFFWGDTKAVVERVPEDKLTDLYSFSSWTKTKDTPQYYGTADYDDSVYIAGDFTKSLEYVRNLATTYTDNYGPPAWVYVNGVDEEAEFIYPSNKDYDLFSNNCVQQSVWALRKGVLNDGTSVNWAFLSSFKGLIPNNDMVKLHKIFYNSAFTKEEYIKQLTEKYIELENPPFWKKFINFSDRFDYYKVKSLLTPYLP